MRICCLMVSANAAFVVTYGVSEGGTYALPSLESQHCYGSNVRFSSFGFIHLVTGRLQKQTGSRSIRQH
jgi:hypothetical protein